MKNILIFVAYFLLGIFLIFSFRQLTETINFHELNSPLPQFSFSLDTPPSQSLQGAITSLSGEVEWQSRVATEPAKITKPRQVQQGEGVKTLESGQAMIVFPDIAGIAVYPKTEINIIQTLPSNILIGQNNGAADYKKLNGNHLSVRSQNLLVKINQGEIMISVDENKPYITVNVITGSVTVVYNDINFITKLVDVSPGESLLFRTDTKRITVYKD
jgi:hypothetical protein